MIVAQEDSTIKNCLKPKLGCRQGTVVFGKNARHSFRAFFRRAQNRVPLPITKERETSERKSKLETNEFIYKHN